MYYLEKSKSLFLFKKNIVYTLFYLHVCPAGQKSAISHHVVAGSLTQDLWKSSYLSSLSSFFHTSKQKNQS